MTHVFISYYRDKGDNEGFAYTTIQRIKEGIGVDCWIDAAGIRAGEEEWFRQIESAIQTSFALVVIATEESLKRPWVNYEWIFALGSGIPVIPVVFDDIPNDLWNQGFYRRLDTLQRRNLTHDDSAEWQRLLTDLRNALARKRGTIIAPPDASSFIDNAVAALNDVREDTWLKTIDVLEKCDDPHAAHILEQTAELHHTPHARHLAALAHVRKTRFAGICWPAMRDAALQGDRNVRQRARKMLGDLGGHQAVEILTEALQHEEDLLLRTGIIHALGLTARNGDSHALQPLTEYYERTTNGHERQAIIEALRHFKTDDATEVLLGIMPNLQGESLKAATSSLIEIGTESAKAGIKNLILTAEKADFQSQIATYLGTTDKPLALQILKDLRNDPKAARARHAIGYSIDRLEPILRRRESPGA